MNRYDKAQARCIACNVRHTWERKAGPAVATAICPDCGNPLSRTTGQIALRLPTHEWDGYLGIGQRTTRTASEERAAQQARYAKPAGAA